MRTVNDMKFSLIRELYHSETEVDKLDYHMARIRMKQLQKWYKDHPPIRCPLLEGNK